MLTSFFSQSFIGGIVAFRTLSRPQFAALQAKIFPIYFGLQTALPAILAVTYPGARSPRGTASGLQGTFAEVNRWSVLAPLATMFVAGLANLLVIGPTTTKIMAERKQQGMSYSLLWNVLGMGLIICPLEVKDGKKSYDPAPHSKEMLKLNQVRSLLLTACPWPTNFSRPLVESTAFHHW
jgi:hypothetical protein